ncbi:MAG: response regulator [Verrucomicrobia bacterium]|jgi:signal transduction histidine kinase|nr:response regulator [Verrucomicrobiota bacterium]
MTDPEQINLLLIEDDPESGPAMLNMLGRRHVEVTLVPSAEQGLLALEKHTFDAAVADIRLEGMTGVEFLAKVRERDPEFPVILLTGYDSLDSAVQAIRLGAQDYILKPLEGINDLLIPVRKAIAAHRLKSENDRLTRKLQSLASEMVLVEDRERHRIACGLHDSIGQDLLGLKLRLETAAVEPEHRCCIPLLKSLEETVQGLVGQTRSLIFKIYPTTLHDLGLSGALENYVYQIGDEHNIQCEFDAKNNMPSLSEDLRILLFRSARELIFNITKHAEAAHLSVKVTADDDDVTITIADNGKGFDPTKLGDAAGRGFGLFSIRQHLQSIEGSLTVDSKPGTGTQATIRAPYGER